MKDFKFPDILRPTFKAFEQLLIGILLWHHPDLIDRNQIIRKLEEYGKSGKNSIGIALSKDLNDLPDGSEPNVSIPLQNSILPLLNGHDHVKVISYLTQFFVGHCYSILEEKNILEKHRNEPEVQFLKHIRNGCFHGNKFNIHNPATTGKKWKTAKWRGKEITLSLNGKRIFRDNLNEQEFFLNWGDPFLLFQDICTKFNIK